MKVVILHQHFKTPYEGGAIRSYYLAKALVDAGIETTVVTASNQTQHSQRTIDGIEVRYLPINYSNHFGFFNRSKAFVRFALASVREISSIKNIDLCYAISVPLTVGAAAVRIKKKLQIPFVFEVGDLWPDAPVQMGFIRNGLLKKMLYWMERKIYLEATSIVALSAPIQSAIQQKAPEKVIHLIPNVSDTAFFLPEKKKSDLEARFGTESQFVVSYIGAVGFANGLDHLVECARASQKASLPVKLLICGEGAVLEPLIQKTAELGLTNISFLPFTARDGVKEIMNVTDAAFISFLPYTILETGSPNKYFDGLSAGKAILINFEGWVKEEIERAQCGFYVNVHQPEEFVGIVKTFLNNPSTLQTCQVNARALAERKYSRLALSREFVNIIMKASEKNNL